MLAQSVEVDIFQKTATLTTAQIGIRVRATGASVDYIGVTFYTLYQSANAAPQSAGVNTVVGVDDSKLVTTFGWGSSARFTNPAQGVSIDPGPPGGQIYDRRYVYGNIDETGGTNVQTLISSRWDTLIYITFNTLQVPYPQGGNAYLQKTSEAPGAALTDPSFANIAFLVNSGDRPLGLSTLPVLFTNYNVNCGDKGTLITWSTATESNSKNFEIEKSINGVDWIQIDQVAAAGNSADLRNYQYLDLEGGNNFYRIRQVDEDGRFIYTNVKHTDCKTDQFDVILYPVPAKDNLNVVIRSDKAVKTDLQIMDMNGRTVRRTTTQINKGNNNIILNIIDLSVGQYMLISSDPSIIINKRFTIAR